MLSARPPDDPSGEPVAPAARRPGARLRLALRLRYRRSRLRHRLERALLELAPTEGKRLLALTLLLGVLCGLVAVAFHTAIRFAEEHLIERAMRATGAAGAAFCLIVPTAGGLFAGLVLRLVPGARGSGIPQVKATYALRHTRLPLGDAVAKFLLCPVQIGCGASLGREGPTVQICAGLSASLGRWLRISERNVRRLLPVGGAAGIAAAFNAPVAAVTFTIEELVGTLDQTVLSGVVLAAAIAAVVERAILGEHPVLVVERRYGLEHGSSLVLYALLGLVAGWAALSWNAGLLGLRARFQRLRALPAWSHPALGGVVVGALIVVAFRGLGLGGINGGGYEVLDRALGSSLPARTLLALALLKTVATLVSYASGGAGGVFAPVLFVGGMLGGAVGHLDRLLLDHGAEVPGAFALVGMGALFAGVIRAPITSVLIIFEMTGSYGLILPLMVSNMTAYLIARRSEPMPLYDALLAQDGIHLPERRVLGEITVGQAMSRAVETVAESEPFDRVMRRLRDSRHSAFPVLDAGGHLTGLLLLEDLRAHLGDEALSPVAVAADLCRVRPPTAHPDETLEAALERMTRGAVDHLPVLDGDQPPRLVGMLTLHDLLGVASQKPDPDRP